MLAYFSGILLISKNPLRLANFYRDLFAIPLTEEQHGESDTHYGCELGDIHFAIHGHHEEGEGTDFGTGAVKIAFEVFDISAFSKKASGLGVPLLYEARDMGFMKMTALRDPDGNLVEATELSDGWFKHIEEQRSKGHDMLSAWKKKNRS